MVELETLTNIEVKDGAVHATARVSSPSAAVRDEELEEALMEFGLSRRCGVAEVAAPETGGNESGPRRPGAGGGRPPGR